MRSLFESLRPYAREPRPENPPELLPWSSADEWGLDGAARSAFGLLAAGEQPGPRLYAMADYLLTFYTAADRSTDYPDAHLLNGAALALMGYLSHGQHPEAELWRVTGCARLSTEAHKRKAALENHMLADCVQAVCRAADETGLPLLADLLTLRERMWGRLVDHSRAERLHISEEEYPAHMIEPMPVEQVGEWMRSRDWQQKARAPEYMFEANLEEAEQTLNNLLTLRAHMLVRHQFGSDIDWHLRLFDDVESTVSINSQMFLHNLVGAFIETGDQRYADKTAWLLWSFYRQNPLPNHHQPTGPWRTLETGSRQWREWMDVIGYMGATDAFDAATHAMLARSRFEHMRYLLAYCGGPNNWYQVEASGMAVGALYSPELKQADAYLRVALRRLKWLNSFAYYEDGFQFELTHLYHVFPTSAIFSVVQAARAREVELPQDYVALVEKAHDMYLYARQPDYLLPMFNDCNPYPYDPAPALRFSAEVFNRPDHLWGATHGAEGQPPDHASHTWPAAGYYLMRDAWKPEGQFLFFDGAPWGASHQHEDKLTFTLYANGRLLIGDPNIYSYAMTELTHYFKSSRGHNLVMVDGKGQARRFRPEAKLSTLGRNEWVTRPQFDFVSSEYLEGYAPDPYPERGAPEDVDASIHQRRAIFYVKPGYWILSDLMTATDDQPHKLEQIFHLAALHTPDSPQAMEAGEVSVSAQGALSCNPDVGNIAILPVDPEGLEARAQKGETSPAVGWYGILGEFPAWDATFERTQAFPARMDVVLYPLAAGQSELPQVTRLLSTPQVSALRVQGADLDDTYVLCEEEAGEVALDGIRFEGRALLVRRKPELQVLSVAPRTVKIDGQTVEPVA